MKNIILLSLLTAGLTFTACTSGDSPTTDGSTIIATPESLTLERADSSKTLDLALSCGCGFTMMVTGASGDTDVITCKPVTGMMDRLTKHCLKFTYSPSKATTGPHKVKFDILAKKKTYTYTSSVVVEAR